MNQFSWVVTAHLLAATASTPLWGKLGDLHGREPVYQDTFFLFLLGAVLAGVSQTMGQLIGCRALLGLGGGCRIVTAQAIIADVVLPREHGRLSARR